MQPKLVQSIYVSAAKRPMTEDELARLLAVCRTNNRRDDITGILVYFEGSFMQVLEGPQESVRRMMEVVGGDPRHCQVTLLTEEPVEERSFPEWTMGFARPGQEELLALEGSNDFYAEGRSLLDLGPGTAKKLLEMFRRNNR
ncbi:BLUF domain-containing protein [bacterium]|nr:MAG: BLUF domain-containing protein [bacterium]